MSKLGNIEKEVLAYIDAITTIIEKNKDLFSEGLAASISLSPFDYLLSILSKKVSSAEMVEWLVNMLTSALPTIELGVKGAILSNLKRIIDCNTDPTIPEWLRMNPDDPNDTTRGLYINLRSVDYNSMLLESPFTKQGMNMYFGVNRYYEIQGTGERFMSRKEAVERVSELVAEGQRYTVDSIVKKGDVSEVSELARASDFNAYLWFVKNKANFTRQKSVSGDANTYKYNDVTLFDGTTVLGPLTGTYNNASGLLPFSTGDVLKQTYNGVSLNTLAICLKAETEVQTTVNTGYTVDMQEAQMQTAPSTTKYTFVPVSPSSNGATWYVNKGTFFNFCKKNPTPRDYGTDRPLCHVRQVSKTEILSAGEKLAFSNDYVKFQIMPAPFIHVPVIDASVDGLKLSYDGEPFFRFKKILFNKDGVMDKDGNYTVSVTGAPTIKNKQAVYPITHNNTLTVDFSSGNYFISGRNNFRTCLVECFKGRTVYDFNYDFVMGMQLFDAKVVASQLIQLGTNILRGANSSLGVYLGGINKTESAYQMRIAEIVKNIVESTAYEASDCFYTFSNDKFNDMLDKAELKRAGGYNFAGSTNSGSTLSLDEAYDILNEYSDSATLQENKDVLTRAITQATASITDEILPSEQYNAQLNLVETLIKGLVFTIVQSILTPKIIILFEVNKRLMGDSAESLSIEDFLKSISGLITDIVTEIRDIILKSLLDFVISILRELIEQIYTLLNNEHVQHYAELIRQLFRLISLFKSHREPLDSQLDEVDYADIDNIEQPVTQEC